MFDIISSVKSRYVTHSVSLGDLIEIIKNPSNLHRDIISFARKENISENKYNSIKSSLPCFVPNFKHKDYVNSSSRVESTGFIYIDVDDNTSEITHPSIAARWRSLSNRGMGYLVAVEGLDSSVGTEDLRKVTEAVAKITGLPMDSKAVSLDRLNVISHDEEAFYNPNAKPLEVEELIEGKTVSNTEEELEENKKCSNTHITKTYNRLGVNEHFYSDKMRYSNLEDYLVDYKFQENEKFKYLEDKIEYVEVYIPEKIKKGERNSRLYNILSMMYGLNPNVEKTSIASFAYKVNASRCETPLNKAEINEIVGKILRGKPFLFSNRSKRFLFNEEMELTTREKQSIAGKTTSQKRAEESNRKINEFLNNYNVHEEGRLFMKDIAKGTGLSYSTIRRRGEEIKEMIELINKEIKKVA